MIDFAGGRDGNGRSQHTAGPSLVNSANKESFFLSQTECPTARAYIRALIPVAGEQDVCEGLSPKGKL